jgi:DNA-binding NarL/FixJ family response regulator
VLADDHPLIRQCVREILAEKEELEIVAETNDGQALLDLLLNGFMTPDLIIVDISMPRLDGSGAIERIKMLRPHIKALVLTGHKDEKYIAEALSLGAAGYLLKDDVGMEMVLAIDKIRQGATYLSSLSSLSSSLPNLAV